MQRFVVEENIRRFKDILEHDTDLEMRRIVGELLADAEADLAEMDRAAQAGLADSLFRTSQYAHVMNGRAPANRTSR